MLYLNRKGGNKGMMSKKAVLLVILFAVLFISHNRNIAYAGSVAEASPTAPMPQGTLVNFEVFSNMAQNRIPLSKDEIQEQKVNSALEWAEDTIENFDGIPFISQGAAQLISFGQGVNKLNKHIKKKYHLHLKADDSGAAVAYKIKF